MTQAVEKKNLTVVKENGIAEVHIHVNKTNAYNLDYYREYSREYKRRKKLERARDTKSDPGGIGIHSGDILAS